MKYYIVEKSFCNKNPFFMFLANFIFVASHLQIQPAVELNKALTSL